MIEKENNLLCRKCIVQGRVQGVFFRQGTFDKAHELGVTGWVRNLSNGNVEVLACGTMQQLDDLCEWLWEGPPAARVEEVQVTDVKFEEHLKFQIVR